MKLVIAGSPKTGTTGLFYKIRNSVAGPVRELFEPGLHVPEPVDEARSVLAKKLIIPGRVQEFESFASFDKKIGIVRDPRDWMISSLLYSVYHMPRCYEDAAITARLLTLLQEKGNDPASVSVLAILSFIWSINSQNPELLERRSGSAAASHPSLAHALNHYKEHLSLMTGFFDHHPDYFVVKYEDFVEGRLEELENYLGFALAGKAVVGTEFQRVIRTKGAGDWRNWLTEEDVDFFQPVFDPFLRKFGYADEWELAAAPRIPAEHAAGYVGNLIAERNARALMGDSGSSKALLTQAKAALSRLYGSSGQRVEDLHALQVAFTLLGRSLEKTEAERTRAQGELEETRVKLKTIREERSAIHRSLSWKVSQPLRSIQKRLRPWLPKTGSK